MEKVENKNIVARSQQDGNKIADFLTADSVKNRLKKVLGNNADHIITSIVAAVSSNPELEKVKKDSILQVALIGAGLNLSPSPQVGHFYFVPYKGVAQFQLGSKGYIQLAVRSGFYKHINVIEIKKGEMKKFNILTEDFEFDFIEDIKEREKAETVGYFAYFELLNGFKKCSYWTIEQIKSHKEKYAKTDKIWSQHFTKMAQKTVLKNLLNMWGVLSTDLEKAIQYDGAVIDESGKAQFIDIDYTELEVIEDVKPETKQEVLPPEEKTENQEIVDDLF